MGSIVAIVGRPNVGKSTLFNRLVEQRLAITDPTAGTTRDRHYGKAEWNGVPFSVIDTGGYVSNSGDVFEQEIRRQVRLAIDEADLILFLVDVEGGITSTDEAIAGLLRKARKPVLLAANKVDTGERQYDAAEFYGLGFGELFAISAQSGFGTGELLDRVVAGLPSMQPEADAGLPKIAIVGRPNVGKSSLANALLGEERTIVTPIAGTTRDTVHSRYKVFGFDALLLDTAGLRRKAKVEEDIEFYSTLRSVRAIEESDVCLLLIDAREGMQQQDLHIFGLVVRNGKGVVIVVNKWDLIEKETSTAKEVEAAIRARTAPFTDLPIVFTSVMEKQRIHKVMEVAMQVHANRNQRIATRRLNEAMLPEIERHPPPVVKSKSVHIKYVHQLPGVVPAFAFFANLPQYVKESYARFLENKLREHFTFTGVPIRVFFRKK